MTKSRSRRPAVLPPPVATILLFAADGLSSWKGSLSAAERPKAPSCLLWVPMFREFVESDEGLRILHALATAGMRAWRCPPSVIQSVDAAFGHITFRAMSIVALQHFTDTADRG